MQKYSDFNNNKKNRSTVRETLSTAKINLTLTFHSGGLFVFRASQIGPLVKRRNLKHKHETT